MSWNDDEPQFADPPRLARLLLRVCCASARLEELEGDLHEIYTRRRARSGATRAGLEYVADVLDVCVRQGLARITARTSGRRLLHGALRIYPGRIRACLVLAAAVLVLFQAQWTGLVPTMLFVIDGIFEVIVLANAVISLGSQLFFPPRASGGRHASKGN